MAPLAIVKLGGAQALSGRLHRWLQACAAQGGRVVIVSGGGPFADLVRKTQAAIGFDDEAAHDMAMMAMSQFGRALTSLAPGFELIDDELELRRALVLRVVPIWSPLRMAREAGLKASWDLTSDSLAAWLAGRLGADRIILVKHGDPAPAEALAVRGIVDALFPAYLARSGARAFLASPTDPERLAEGLDGDVFPAIGLSL